MKRTVSTASSMDETWEELDCQHKLRRSHLGSVDQAILREAHCNQGPHCRLLFHCFQAHHLHLDQATLNRKVKRKSLKNLSQKLVALLSWWSIDPDKPRPLNMHHSHSSHYFSHLNTTSLFRFNQALGSTSTSTIIRSIGDMFTA